MGWRIRKSFGGKGFRVNVSKSGIGYSVGGKGFRVTKTAKGNIRTTYSIPGTGISYVTETSNRGKSSTIGDNYACGTETKTSTIYLVLLIIVSIALAISIIATICSYVSKQEYEKKYIETFYDYDITYADNYKLADDYKWIEVYFVLTNQSNCQKNYNLFVEMVNKEGTILAENKIYFGRGDEFLLDPGVSRTIKIRLYSPDGGKIQFSNGMQTYSFKFETKITDRGFAPPT